jgi:hypothetical protein
VALSTTGGELGPLALRPALLLSSNTQEFHVLCLLQDLPGVEVPIDVLDLISGAQAWARESGQRAEDAQEGD